MSSNRRSGAMSGWARRRARLAAAPAEAVRLDVQSQQPAAEPDAPPARKGAAMRARYAKLLTGCLAFGSAPLDWPHLAMAIKTFSF